MDQCFVDRTPRYAHAPPPASVPLPPTSWVTNKCQKESRLDSQTEYTFEVWAPPRGPIFPPDHQVSDEAGSLSSPRGTGVKRRQFKRKVNEGTVCIDKEKPSQQAIACAMAWVHAGLTPLVQAKIRNLDLNATTTALTKLRIEECNNPERGTNINSN